MQSGLVATFVINLILAQSLGELWGSVNQVLVAMNIPVTSTAFPSTVLTVSGVLVQVFAFDVIQSESLNEYIFGFSEQLSTPFSANFEFLKMDSRSAIAILGPEFYFAAALAVGYPLLHGLVFVFKSSNIRPAVRSLRNAQRVYTTNSLIRIGIQFFLVLGFAALLNITCPVVETLSD